VTLCFWAFYATNLENRGFAPRLWMLLAMRNVIVSVLIAVALIALQVAIYTLFLKQPTSTWGATASEVAAPMAGDEISAEFQSTRAITIDAPLGETWIWLNQLGADRVGFFSYTFIEQFLGYETRAQTTIRSEFPVFQVGDIIRGSIFPAKSVIVYEFPVLEVLHEAHLVVQNWGAFQLVPISDTQTRLIIRTHRPAPSGWLRDAFEYYIAEGLHFVMERATLRGFKARVEAGEGPEFDDSQDRLWFYSIMGAAVAIAVLILWLQGARKVVLPAVLSTAWTFTLLCLNPVPLYSLGLLALVVAVILHQVFFHKRQI